MKITKKQVEDLFKPYTLKELRQILNVQQVNKSGGIIYSSENKRLYFNMQKRNVEDTILLDLPYLYNKSNVTTKKDLINIVHAQLEDLYGKSSEKRFYESILKEVSKLNKVIRYPYHITVSRADKSVITVIHTSCIDNLKKELSEVIKSHYHDIFEVNVGLKKSNNKYDKLFNDHSVFNLYCFEKAKY